ncbi:two component transcriptional regulator, winged helix family protein [Paenibacillus vortex V453]|uniref:Two component transcriptional regulator, winged helix family protein n=1 Tax=Paenibacillus vortex V453 TaxID=715225 RepID=A0A2R9SV55_9BACL|nr:response regulator transcription factor [Paenibacillus vortex]EFU41268.1 two component transcriptional regulator, winged helix family protein [Paenibacillus vortex V453]
MEKVILIAANNQERVQQLMEKLGQAGYKVTHALNYSEVVAALQRTNADLLLMDSKLPGMSHFNLVQRLTGRGEQIPIIVIGNDGSDEAIQALESGAHDYIPNEWDTRELLARISNLLRLFQTGRKEQDEIIRIGDLAIDPLCRNVTRENETLALTHREYDLLLFLARRQGQVCTREDILREVWDYDFHTGTNVVDVYILHLREKIDKGRRPKLLRTIRGIGYKLLSQDEIDANTKDRLP